MPKEKLVCNCNKTMPLDAKALRAALKLDSTPRLSSELCRQHLAAFEAAVKSGSDLVVACTQEAPLFTELHEKLQAEFPEIYLGHVFFSASENEWKDKLKLLIQKNLKVK